METVFPPHRVTTDSSCVCNNDSVTLNGWISRTQTFSRAPVIELLCPAFIKLGMTQRSYLGEVKEKFKVNKTC